MLTFIDALLIFGGGPRPGERERETEKVARFDMRLAIEVMGIIARETKGMRLEVEVDPKLKCLTKAWGEGA